MDKAKAKTDKTKASSSLDSPPISTVEDSEAAATATITAAAEVSSSADSSNNNNNEINNKNNDSPSPTSTAASTSIPPILWTTHRLTSEQIYKVDQLFHKVLWLDMFETSIVVDLMNRRLGRVKPATLTPAQRHALTRVADHHANMLLHEKKRLMEAQAAAAQEKVTTASGKA